MPGRRFHEHFGKAAQFTDGFFSLPLFAAGLAASRVSTEAVPADTESPGVAVPAPSPAEMAASLVAAGAGGLGGSPAAEGGTATPGMTRTGGATSAGAAGRTAAALEPAGGTPCGGVAGAGGTAME